MRPLPFVLIALTCSAPALSAQVANNTALVGTVRDPSGSVIAGAQVKAQNLGTGVVYTGTANDHGDYSIQFIAPGTYSVTVTGQGFQQVTKTGIVVTTDQSARTDFALAVGSESTSITISATTPPIETDDANLGENLRHQDRRRSPSARPQRPRGRRHRLERHHRRQQQLQRRPARRRLHRRRPARDPELALARRRLDHE